MSTATRHSGGPTRRGHGRAALPGVWLIAGYVLLAALPVGLAFALNPVRGEGFLHEVGKAAGLMGFALLALQVALGSRLKVLDRPFGLDVVVQFHKGMGMFAVLLLVLHPVLLALSAGSAWLFSFDTPWQIDLGKWALLLLLATVALALGFRKLGMDYRVWRLLHKGAIVVVILGFVHGLAMGSDLRSAGARGYWWLLFGLAVGLFTYRNVVVPAWGRRRFRVAAVEAESHDTWTLRLEPEDGRPLRYEPGQFMFLKLLRPGRPSEEHPFTISSSPTQEGFVTVTIKESGDFTNTIGQTRPGDGARIEAPYGRFSFVHHRPRSFLFIAGGVGITPIRSMLRSLCDTGDDRPAVLIYGNKTERDILFRAELDALPANVRVVHVLSAPGEGWSGPRGYVTADLLRQHAADVLGEADVYLCGPPPMMDKVIRDLRLLGVPDGRIHSERFAI